LRVDDEDDLPAISGFQEPGKKANEDIGVRAAREDWLAALGRLFAPSVARAASQPSLLTRPPVAK
jgi:hypothetical protein